MSADYFAVATAIARRHEVDRKSGICRCNAYAYPHREWSGSCTGPIDHFVADQISQWDREELAAFDRAESRAINAGRGGF